CSCTCASRRTGPRARAACGAPATMRAEPGAVVALVVAAIGCAGKAASPVPLEQALAEAAGSVRQIATPFPDSHLYLPADGEPRPGVVLLHGSGGAASGITDLGAIRYARAGFAALAFAY